MTLAIAAEPAPLQVDADGSVRVADTRVLLDTVIAAYAQGASAEQIVDQYPALNLAQVYAVIAFYLRHADEVDAYLTARRKDADRLRSEVKSKYSRPGIRKCLEARMQASQSK